MTEAERIAQLERRVKDLEGALQQAIEYISDDADMDQGADGEDVPNRALALSSDLEYTLRRW